MAASNIVKVDASGLQPQATAVPGGLEVQFLENGVPVGTPTLLPAPDGAVVVDPEITPLTHGGFVVTWLDAESHAQTANFAVFDAAGALVTDQVVSPGFATDVEAAALPNGGFVMLDAQGDLFGQ